MLFSVSFLKSGLDFSQDNREAILKITADNNDDGYEWIVDTDLCADILNIDSETSHDGSSSSQTLTLTAFEFGDCNLRLTYARPWLFTSFDEEFT